VQNIYGACLLLSKSLQATPTCTHPVGRRSLHRPHIKATPPDGSFLTTLGSVKLSKKITKEVHVEQAGVLSPSPSLRPSGPCPFMGIGGSRGGRCLGKSWGLDPSWWTPPGVGVGWMPLNEHRPCSPPTVCLDGRVRENLSPSLSVRQHPGLHKGDHLGIDAHAVTYRKCHFALLQGAVRKEEKGMFVAGIKIEGGLELLSTRRLRDLWEGYFNDSHIACLSFHVFSPGDVVVNPGRFREGCN